MNYFSIEFDVIIDVFYFGWLFQQGFGSFVICLGVFGVGYGGVGGNGYWIGCGYCLSSVIVGRKMYLFCWFKGRNLNGFSYCFNLCNLIVML